MYSVLSSNSSRNVGPGALPPTGPRQDTAAQSTHTRGRPWSPEGPRGGAETTETGRRDREVKAGGRGQGPGWEKGTRAGAGPRLRDAGGARGPRSQCSGVLPVRSVFLVCSQCAPSIIPGVFPLCSWYAPVCSGVFSVFPVCSQMFRCATSVPGVLPVRSVCSQCAPGMFPVCSGVLPVCSPVCSVFPVCSQYVPSVLLVCSQCAPGVFLVCSQDVPVFPVCSQCAPGVL